MMKQQILDVVRRGGRSSTLFAIVVTTALMMSTIVLTNRRREKTRSRRRSIVILRGQMASEKSTAFRMLQTRLLFRNEWCFIDFPNLKRFFKNVDSHHVQRENNNDHTTTATWTLPPTARKRLGKKCLRSVLRAVMEDESRPNIVIEEFCGEELKQLLDLRRANYDVRVIKFQCSAEASMRRNVERRRKAGNPPRTRSQIDACCQYWNDKCNTFTQQCDVEIDTTNLSKEDMVEHIERFIFEGHTKTV